MAAPSSLRQAGETQKDWQTRLLDRLTSVEGSVDSTQLFEVGDSAAPPAILVPKASRAVVIPLHDGPYSPEAMVELMVAHPHYTHAQFAAAFGRKAGWFAAVLASESFQLALDPRRSEVLDPGLTATLDERMRALALQSLDVLSSRLENPEVNEQTILKALEIGTKALGMGQAVPVVAAPTQATGAEAVASRIMEAMDKARERSKATAVDVEVKEVVTVSEVEVAPGHSNKDIGDFRSAAFAVRTTVLDGR